MSRLEKPAAEALFQRFSVAGETLIEPRHFRFSFPVALDAG